MSNSAPLGRSRNGGRLSVGDAMRIVRATATNQLARFAPAAYVRLTGQTGRGDAADESSGDISQYFRQSADAYFEKLAIPRESHASFLAGKTLMEYGPGDLPGVAALMIARGADKVYCVDRFPLVNLSEKNGRVLGHLIDGCQGAERDRLVGCLKNKNDPQAGFDPRRIEYLVRPGGLSGLINAVDLVFSRAVLEHVNDLDATFKDMVIAMRPDASAVHLVDLRSHGLHKSNPLDFLEWSSGLWSVMYSQKGVPNRWRVDRYRSLVADLPIELLLLEATKLAAIEHVAAVRPRLADPFRGVSDEDLRCLGFWLLFRKEAR